MADQKKVLRDLQDVQDTMKRVERRSTARFQAVKAPGKSPTEDEPPATEEKPAKPQPR